MRTIDSIIVLAMRDALERLSEPPSIPYVPHPMEVCRLVLACGGSQISACAAVLHEIVARGQMSESEVEQRYGRAVAERVQSLCGQQAEDEESLLLVCADRVVHLVRWGNMTPPESLVRELNQLHLALRRLEAPARQVLMEQLDSLQPLPVVQSLPIRRPARPRKSRRVGV